MSRSNYKAVEDGAKVINVSGGKGDGNGSCSNQ